MIPSGAMQITANGIIDGDRKGALSMSGSPGFGLLNQAGRVLVFAQSFVAGDVTIDVQLTATIDNLMPTVSLSTTPQIECNATGGANVAIPATVADADGHHHSSQWYVDGALVAANVDTLHTFAPLGPHAVEVVVFDEDGGVATATTSFTVVDTTPPTVSVDALCLWPPDHEQFVIDASVVHVTDVCDPHPSVAFVSGTSSQSDNGLGDGNTSDDIVVHPSTVCVRSERDGRVLAGRTYTVIGTARDAANNPSAFQLPIEVPHDHSRASGCDVFGGDPVDGNDPRCVPLPMPPRESAAAGEDRLAGGCAAAGRSGLVLALVALAGILRRRR